jgi:glycosyltransferase involved in cell wall biosynthesis
VGLEDSAHPTRLTSVKILFLNPIGGLGGAERVLLTAVGGIRQARPSAVVRVVALTDGPLLEAATAAGAEVEVVPMPSALRGLGDSQARGRWRTLPVLALRAAAATPAVWLYARRLRAAVARFAPDIVHSNGIKTHLLARFALPRGVPVVWHLHDFYGLRPLAARLLRRVRRRARVGVAISQAVADDTAKAVPGLPVAVIPNAVDLARFTPTGPACDLDGLAGLSPAAPGTVRVGLVATFARWKGHLAFLDAAARLSRDAPPLPVRWYIVGGPIYHTAAQFTEAELRAAAAERGIAERVGFVPFRSDPAEAYRALDVVVHASTLPEPFGLTIAEAMGCGRAVVVSAAGGAAELFTDGHDALGVHPGDPVGMAGAVRRLVEDPALRARLDASARATAERRFDAAQYGPRLLEVYQRLLQSHE